MIDLLLQLASSRPWTQKARQWKVDLVGLEVKLGKVMLGFEVADRVEYLSIVAAGCAVCRRRAIANATR